MKTCKQSGICGGCIYRQIPYKDQPEMKAKEVLRLLKERDIAFAHFLGVQASPDPYGYRNKMEYTFGDETKGGAMTLGLHKQGSFLSILNVDDCLLVDPDFNQILSATLSFCIEKGYPFYRKKSHQGLLRNLVLRKGQHTGELLVNLVTSTQKAFDEEAFVKMIMDLNLNNHVVGILRTENDGKADAVNPDNVKTLMGRDYYNDTILGLSFQVSAFSFFQPNVHAVEIMYAEALNMIDDLSGKTVFDLYSGTGTITQLAACRAKKAVGIELVEEAVVSALENARRNKLTNCTFLAGDVLTVLDEMEDKPDMIIMDPPRSGIHPKALQKILNYQVNQILYISCNPKSLAENLVTAVEYGYKPDRIKVYDNFPFTAHVETVVLMSRVEK